ncbi:MAG: hypothetical protein AB7L94_21940 [Kofleriaceae bacterium]
MPRYEHQAVGLGLLRFPDDTLMYDREYFTQPQTYNDMFGR